MHTDVERETDVISSHTTSADGNEDESSGINISRVSYTEYRIPHQFLDAFAMSINCINHSLQ